MNAVYRRELKANLFSMTGTIFIVFALVFIGIFCADYTFGGASAHLEYAIYNGNYYGTPKKTVEELLLDGKDVMLEIEPQGALQVKKLFPEAVLIFLVPPSMAELKNRLITRGRESSEEIEQRITNAKWELEQADKYTVLIENDDIEDCVCDVLDYIELKRKERNKVNSLINENV